MESAFIKVNLDYEVKILQHIFLEFQNNWKLLIAFEKLSLNFFNHDKYLECNWNDGSAGMFSYNDYLAHMSLKANNFWRVEWEF